MPLLPFFIERKQFSFNCLLGYKDNRRRGSKFEFGRFSVQSNLVPIAAYLLVCPRCGSHACVVLPGGVKTTQFISRASGRAAIEILRANGYIDDVEAYTIGKALEVSTLVESICSETEVTMDKIFSDVNPVGHLDEDEEAPPPRPRVM